MNSSGLYIYAILYAIGWIALFLAPLRHQFCWIFGRSCAMALAISYCVLLFANVDQIQSLATLLFSLPIATQQFWVALPLSALHILSFNLFIGSWQVEDGPKHHMPHAIIAPCLIITALVGPLGFALHILIRDYWKWRSRKKGCGPPQG
jgi:hypothetical protein